MARNFLLVAAGGALGTMLRYGAYLLFNNYNNFPWATLLINITGSFLVGIVMAMAMRSSNSINESTRLFLATGVCGGFTTFSAFSYENLQLIQSGKYGQALLYIFASLLLGIAAAWAGLKLINT